MLMKAVLGKFSLKQQQKTKKQHDNFQIKTWNLQLTKETCKIKSAK